MYRLVEIVGDNEAPLVYAEDRMAPMDRHETSDRSSPPGDDHVLPSGYLTQ